MTTSCTDNHHPYYEAISKLQKPLHFFTKNPERLAYVSLGEALDFVSHGGMNYVVWPDLDKKGMIGFIQNWMGHQEPKIQCERIPDPKIEGVYSIKEKSREFFYLWNRFQHDFPVALPFINHQNCPVNESHKGTIRDLAGRIRCLHIDTQEIKPSFSRFYQVTEGRIDFQDDKPMDPSLFQSDEDEVEIDPKEIERYERQMDRYIEEEPVTVLDPCYTIISDIGINLSLESVLRRLDVNKRFTGGMEICIYPFSGFELAGYVKAWWEQPGARQFFMKEGAREDYRVFSDFQPVSD